MSGRISYLLVAVAAALLLLPSGEVMAQSGGIEVVSSSVTSEFPLGIRFRVEARSDSEIKEIAVRFRVGEQTRGEYTYLDLGEAGQLVDSELLFRTSTGNRYIPPGTIIRYNFEITDAEGNQLDTEREEFIYEDARFQWDEISEGAVTVAYHGPVLRRAEAILDAIIQTVNVMGPLLGADLEKPIRVTVYNNVPEMLDALPPGSPTIRRDLITEGQAFVRFGTLLVLGGASRPRGTASHEVMHILTHRAGDSVGRRVPSWLSEGLSELGNLDPGVSYDIALQFALANDRLLPITSMASVPGNPEDVIIFYGQARSIVQYMVVEYGADKMGELMATMKAGTNVDDSIQKVYGVSRVELENLWRDTLGAPEFVPPNLDALLPTPLPAPVIELFTFDSLRNTGAAATPQAAEVPSPTAAPEPTATPVVEATPEAVAKAIPDTSASEPEAPAEADPADQPTGGACGVPVHGSPIELFTLGPLLGLVGLGFRRRFSRKKAMGDARCEQ